MPTNQLKLIATLGTPTAAKSNGPADVHLKGQATIPHENIVQTSKSTSGMTSTNTLIEGKQIVLEEQTNIGPPSDFAWPGEVGKTSGVTGMEANVKKGSPNVKADRLPIARYTDPTFQNKKNCDGQIVITDAALAAQMLEKQKALRCKIKTLTTTCGKRQAGKEDRLQVLYGSSVDLVAKRINALALKADGTEDDSSTPECDKGPNHTHFVIFRQGFFASFGKVTEVRETRYGDKITIAQELILKADDPKPPGEQMKAELPLNVPTRPGGTDGSLANAPLTNSNDPSPAPINISRSDPDNVRIARDAEINPRSPFPRQNQGSAAAVTQGGAQGMQDNFISANRSNPPNSVGFDGLTDNQRNRVQEARKYEADRKKYDQLQKARDIQAQNKKAIAAMEKKKTRDAFIETSVMTIIEVIKSRPYTVNVEALSCAGNKKVAIEVYPKGKFLVDVYAVVQPIVSAMKMIQNTIEVFKKFFSPLGISVKIAFCENPYGFVSWQWVEGEDWLVHPKFECEIGFEKLLEVSLEYRIGILQFAGPLGKLAVWLLEQVNVRGDVGIFFAAYIGINASAAMSMWKFEPGPVKSQLAFEFGVFAELTAGTAFNCRIEIKAEWKPRFGEKTTASNGKFLCMTLLAGKVVGKVEINVQADMLGFRNGRQADWTFAELNYGQQDLNWLPNFPAAFKST